ncbi:hypothetical protein KKHLCK_11400 [Candidatus Electrothrix laxa]
MKKTTFLILSVFVLSYPCFALDMDDGIEIDDSIEDYHELGEIQNNISFIVMNAITRAYTTMNIDEDDGLSDDSSVYVINDSTADSSNELDEIESLQNDSSVSAVNSIIIGAGSNINGDIIIIDNSKGEHAAISQ